MIQQSKNAFVLREKVQGEDVWKQFKSLNFVPFLTSVEDWQDWILFLLWKSYDPRSGQPNFNYEEKYSLPFELGNGRDETTVFDETLELIKKIMIPEKKKLFEEAMNNLLKNFWNEENFLDTLFVETTSCHDELFHFSSKNLLFLLEKNISENSFSTAVIYLVSLKGSDALPEEELTKLLLNLRHKYRNDDEKLSDVTFAFIDLEKYENAMETIMYMHEVCKSFPVRLDTYLTLGDRGRDFLQWLNYPAIQEKLQSDFFPRMSESVKSQFIEIFNEATANQ